MKSKTHLVNLKIISDVLTTPTKCAVVNAFDLPGTRITNLDGEETKPNIHLSKKTNENETLIIKFNQAETIMYIEVSSKGLKTLEIEVINQGEILKIISRMGDQNDV